MWLWAKPTSDGLNAGVDFVLSLVDVVRRYPPTAREENARRWGPFPDDKHPGHELQIVIVRTFPVRYRGASRPRVPVRGDGSSALPRSTRSSSARSRAPRLGAGAAASCSTSRRCTTSASTDATTPHGRMDIVYDRVSDPVTIELVLTQQGFRVEQFNYGYAGYRDGSGRFDYRFRTRTTNDVLTVVTGYDRGRGRARSRHVHLGRRRDRQLRRVLGPGRVPHVARRSLRLHLRHGGLHASERSPPASRCPRRRRSSGKAPGREACRPGSRSEPAAPPERRSWS